MRSASVEMIGMIRDYSDKLGIPIDSGDSLRLFRITGLGRERLLRMNGDCDGIGNRLLNRHHRNTKCQGLGDIIRGYEGTRVC